MVNRNGCLFHIDFGHFLGNFKSKFGVRRERSPFVFTPQMAWVVTGGQKATKNSLEYQKFCELCCNAFNCVRSSASSLEVMFVLMLSAGMPELQQAEDIGYLQSMLQLSKEPEEAAKAFREEIESSRKDKVRTADNYAHLAKHRG